MSGFIAEECQSLHYTIPKQKCYFYGVFILKNNVQIDIIRQNLKAM